jgi:hypothetical protein
MKILGFAFCTMGNGFYQHKETVMFWQGVQSKSSVKEDTCFAGPFRDKDVPIFGKNGIGAENGRFMQVTSD